MPIPCQKHFGTCYLARKIAVGRPRLRDNGEVLWDGKVRIFPFTYEDTAKRSSKNRPAGTLETKASVSITRLVIKEMILNELLPAIKQTWPDADNRRVIIQQDNARPHIDINDPDFVREGTKDGWNIQSTCQPPNSPDLNVLDLGFFRTIDAIKDQKAPKTITDLSSAHFCKHIVVGRQYNAICIDQHSVHQFNFCPNVRKW
ncbi:unnamed protein product [Cuscuta europaea]|uniref:Transposase n=1 Tax=Cuscuta europaea TaxID=41803 RepID=A0A9P1A006_CUSEU|nr:unnamed protein product [Cuscuta europaea]